MHNKFIRIVAIVIAVLMILMSFSYMFIFGAEVYAADSLSPGDITLIEGVIEKVHSSFKDEVTYDSLVDGAISGIIESLGDKFSEFYATKDEESNFTSSVDNMYSGVGVVLTMENGRCVVDRLVNGGPAEKAGVLAGDIIKRVDGVSTTNKTLDEVTAMLRGETGTSVEVSVIRESTEHVFKIVRATLGDAAIKYSMISGTSIGYIQITMMDSDVSEEFDVAIDKLLANGATSFIFDIRSNLGGYTLQAMLMANRVLGDGIISITETRSGKTAYPADSEQKLDMPIVILANENTASSAEIFEAALKYNGAATVVGTTSYGKGIGQQIYSVDSNRSYKLSTMYFYGPGGETIHEKGIAPDYEVKNLSKNEYQDMCSSLEGFAPMSESVKPVLGSVGLNVYGAQQRLSLMGYSCSVTGTMDADTVRAVSQFQKDSGLYPYGCLDFTTRDKLQKTCAEYPAKCYSADNQLAKAIELLQ